MCCVCFCLNLGKSYVRADTKQTIYFTWPYVNVQTFYVLYPYGHTVLFKHCLNVVI